MAMDDVAVTVPELEELLDASITCAEKARDNMRFDFDEPRQRVCVGLLCVIVEHAKAIRVLMASGLFYAPTVLHRAVLDAHLDIVLVCQDRSYLDSVLLEDALPWNRMLEKAKEGKNPYLAEIADSEHFDVGHKMYAGTVRELRGKKVRKLDAEARFKLAGLEHEYDAVYRMLSAEAHNNVSFVTFQYFDVSSGRAVMLKTGRGASKATMFNVPEIVLAAAEKVLKLCGHGTAVLNPAMTIFDRLYAKTVAAEAARDQSGEKL